MDKSWKLPLFSGTELALRRGLTFRLPTDNVPPTVPVLYWFYDEFIKAPSADNNILSHVPDVTAKAGQLWDASNTHIFLADSWAYSALPVNASYTFYSPEVTPPRSGVIQLRFRAPADQYTEGVFEFNVEGNSYPWTGYGDTQLIDVKFLTTPHGGGYLMRVAFARNGADPAQLVDLTWQPNSVHTARVEFDLDGGGARTWVDSTQADTVLALPGANITQVNFTPWGTALDYIKIT